MKDNSPKYAPCAICKSQPADKTNSHCVLRSKDTAIALNTVPSYEVNPKSWTD